MVVLILQVIKLTNTLCDWVSDSYRQLTDSSATWLIDQPWGDASGLNCKYLLMQR